MEFYSEPTKSRTHCGCLTGEDSAPDTVCTDWWLCEQWAQLLCLEYLFIWMYYIYIYLLLACYHFINLSWSMPCNLIIECLSVSEHNQLVFGPVINVYFHWVFHLIWHLKSPHWDKIENLGYINQMGDLTCDFDLLTCLHTKLFRPFLQMATEFSIFYIFIFNYHQPKDTLHLPARPGIGLVNLSWRPYETSATGGP